MIDGFAQSTIDAARYLILSAPERLHDWLRRHARSAALERIAREQIRQARAAKDGDR